MSVLDLERLVAPVGPDDPVGEDLEYDADFMALERIAKGKPERVMGDEVQPAEEPDWVEVRAKAEQLFGRTKDLRVAVHLTRAAVVRDGFAGLADGLMLIAQLLDQYWDGIHPRLDADDDNDPTSRVNCLMPLTDRAGLVAVIRQTPIVSSPLLGRFSFRDYLIAKGEIPPPQGTDAAPVEMSQIDGAFMEVSVESLSETNSLIERTLAGVESIRAGITERVGASYAPDLDWLQKTLKGMRDLIAERLARRGVGSGPEQANEEGKSVQRSVQGEVSSREDVVALLERVCEYYARHEPSSPVPLVLRRAQRLAQMDFMEILHDMTPSGVSEAEVIGGIRTNS